MAVAFVLDVSRRLPSCTALMGWNISLLRQRRLNGIHGNFSKWLILNCKWLRGLHVRANLRADRLRYSSRSLFIEILLMLPAKLQLKYFHCSLRQCGFENWIIKFSKWNHRGVELTRVSGCDSQRRAKEKFSPGKLLSRRSDNVVRNWIKVW